MLVAFIDDWVALMNYYACINVCISTWSRLKRQCRFFFRDGRRKFKDFVIMSIVVLAFSLGFRVDVSYLLVNFYIPIQKRKKRRIERD